MSSKNIAAVLDKKFGTIELVERPIPTPKSGEILLRNKAVAGNPVEWMVRDYGFGITEYPTVLGSDVSGIIEQVGPNVTKFQVGDRIVGYASVLYTSNADNGAWQTYTLLDEKCVTLLPSHVSFEEGCIFPMALSTTINAFFVQFGLEKPSIAQPAIKAAAGQGLLIWGGGGAMAAFMIQFGKLLGFTVYTTANMKHEDRLRRLGASEVLDYNDPDVIDTLVQRANAAGLKISHAIDAVGQKDSFIASSTILAKSGGPSSKLVSLGNVPDDVPHQVEVFSTVAFTTFINNMDLIEYFFNDWFAEALASGIIIPAPEVQIVPGGIKSAEEVLNKLKEGVSGVKLVVQVE